MIQKSATTHANRSNARLAIFTTGCITALAVPAWGQPINESFKLSASDGAAYDEFGYSIAIGDGIVAVGARHDDDRGPNSGSAYLFDAYTGDQFAKLLANDGEIDDWFGYSIAIADGVVAVGCPLDNEPFYSGAAYLFDANTGFQLAKLIPSDAEESDQVGWSIAIADGIVAVGAYGDDDNGPASGSVYLFDAFTGDQIAKLLPADGAEDDRFGWSVAIGDGIVAVGAPLDDDNGGSSGSAYVFNAFTGAQLFKLLPGDGALSDEFGTSVAVRNGTVAVGAYRDDDMGFDSGSAYLFAASTGVQIAKLVAADGVENDWFGYSIAIDKDKVAVGARYDDDHGDKTGAVYVYSASSGAQLAKLVPSDGTFFDECGNSVAIDNGVVAAGAYHDNDRGDWSGSAYTFETCPADLTHDGTQDTMDFISFLNHWAGGDSVGDWNHDGTINTQDFVAFLNDWAAGCL